jgi:ketosteroid isomerase-like protein
VTEGTLAGTPTGTFRSPQGDIPATGNRIQLRYASVRHIRDGKVASEHLYFDQLEFLQQLGALPPEG